MYVYACSLTVWTNVCSMTPPFYPLLQQSNTTVSLCTSAGMCFWILRSFEIEGS